MTDAEGSTVTAYPMYVTLRNAPVDGTFKAAGEMTPEDSIEQFGENAKFEIVKQPVDVELTLGAATAFTASFECKAVSPANHPLEYRWQHKGASSWLDVSGNETQLTVHETVSAENVVPITGSYRCIVRDTVTGREITSWEAKVIVPKMTVHAYQVGTKPKIQVDIQGGTYPYTITASRKKYQRFDWENNDDFNAEVVSRWITQDNSAFPEGIEEVTRTAHSASYLANIDRYARDKETDYGLIEYYDKRAWTYTFTVTDAYGEKVTYTTPEMQW